MRPLNGPPGIVLRLPKFSLLRRMPADGGGIKQHMRSLQRRQSRALRIPLIPADQCADAADFVSRRESPDRRA